MLCELFNRTAIDFNKNASKADFEWANLVCGSDPNSVNFPALPPEDRVYC